MAHFAKLDSDNLVLSVLKVDDSDCLNSDGVEQESVGIEFLENSTGWLLWKQTSYNTKEGKHYVNSNQSLSSDQTKSLRKNYACIGYRYDPTRDAFIPPKQYDSWVLDETKCIYVAPVTYPTVTTYGTDKEYLIYWDEANQRWLADDEETPQNTWIWNSENLSWNAST